MITPAVQNLTGYNDRSFDQTFIIKEDGIVKPLAGFSVTAQLRITKSAEDAIEDFAVVTIDIEGKVTISMTSTQMLDIEAGKYFYDVRIIEDANPITSNYSYIEGTVDVADTVTHA